MFFTVFVFYTVWKEYLLFKDWMVFLSSKIIYEMCSLMEFFLQSRIAEFGFSQEWLRSWGFRIFSSKRIFICMQIYTLQRLNEFLSFQDDVNVVGGQKIQNRVEFGISWAWLCLQVVESFDEHLFCIHFFEILIFLGCGKLIQLGFYCRSRG